MPRSTHFLAASLLLALLTLAPRVQAQTATHFSIAAGASFPTGVFGDVYDTGYHILGAVDFDRPASPLGFRVDGMFNEFEASRAGSVRIIGLTANGVLKGAALGPYLIGGIGVYGTKPKGGENESDVGFNIGGGFRFGLTGFTAFVEARFHQVTENERFVPLTFGVTF